MKIVCDNKIPFLKGAFEPFADVIYLPGKETTAEAVRDADAIITRTRTACNPELLAGSSVKAIASATIGYDHIDTKWCEANGVFWTNAPGCNSASVAQYISAVLAVECRKYNLKFSELTLGVVGVGNVGGKVAARAKAMGMNVLLNDPPRAKAEGPAGFVGLDEIMAKADIITIHVPLQEDTFHLFDEARIKALKPNQILINSSRGPVVDNEALKKALKTRAIALGMNSAGTPGPRAAVLDVWETEPDLNPELVNLLDISTPHIAGYSADGKANGTTAAVRAIAAKLGLPLTGWSVQDVPAPQQSLNISIDANKKNLQDVLTKAILHTYDIESDSAALRGNPGAFEKLRGDYPVRREFTAYNVTLNGGCSRMVSALEALGFKVNSINEI